MIYLLVACYWAQRSVSVFPTLLDVELRYRGSLQPWYDQLPGYISVSPPSLWFYYPSWTFLVLVSSVLSLVTAAPVLSPKGSRVDGGREKGGRREGVLKERKKRRVVEETLCSPPSRLSFSVLYWFVSPFPALSAASASPLRVSSAFPSSLSWNPWSCAPEGPEYNEVCANYQRKGIYFLLYCLHPFLVPSLFVVLFWGYQRSPWLYLAPSPEQFSPPSPKKTFINADNEEHYIFLMAILYGK